MISDWYGQDGTMSYLGKNRHFYKDQTIKCKQSELFGVDLSRNYDYMWGADDNGSSPDICSDTYRGPEAFSEPETKAMRDFTSRFKNIKLALNLHSFGNNFNVPYNFDDAYNN